MIEHYKPEMLNHIEKLTKENEKLTLELEKAKEGDITVLRNKLDTIIELLALLIECKIGARFLNNPDQIKYEIRKIIRRSI